MTESNPDERSAGERALAVAEPRDLQPRSLARLGILFVLMLLSVFALADVVQTVATGLPPNLSAQPPLLSNAPEASAVPAPRMQAVPAQDLQQFRAREDAILDGYGWVDQKAGVVRIPIARAMELLLQRGLPTRVLTETQMFSDDGEQRPSEASSGRVLERVRP
jgi:hypothetical protein